MTWPPSAATGGRLRRPKINFGANSTGAIFATSSYAGEDDAQSDRWWSISFVLRTRTRRKPTCRRRAAVCKLMACAGGGATPETQRFDAPKAPEEILGWGLGLGFATQTLPLWRPPPPPLWPLAPALSRGTAAGGRRRTLAPTLVGGTPKFFQQAGC